MLYFTLPNFYHYFLINNFYIQLNRKNPEYFQEKCKFIQCSGSFPYFSWNGGFNCNQGAGAYYSDFINCHSKSPVPLRINCANVLLEEFDYYDSMAQAILKANENGSNLIEISNLKLMEFLENQYKNYKFVFSKEADLITPFTPDLLNSITNFNKFSLIGLPYRINDNMDFLKELNNKHLFEITVNTPCPKFCKSYNACALQEHKLQLDYSGLTTFINCPKISYKQTKTLSEIKETYGKLGINHFTFVPIFKSDEECFYFYLYYFIKDDYKEQVITFWREFLESMKENK